MLLVLLFLLGLAVGSFVANLTWRLPRGEVTTRGRSKCDHCGTPLAWYDNIPLFSFLLLLGKSRCCDKPISSRYFWIELVCGFMFVVFGQLVLTGNLQTTLFKDAPVFIVFAFTLLLVSCMLAIFAIDLEHQIIPDKFVFATLSLTFFFLLLFNPNLVYGNLLAGFVSGLFFLLIVLATLGKGMGMGDIKLAVAGGVVLGGASVTWIFLSFVVGATIGLLLILIGKAAFGRKMAFGPFMAFCFLITLIFGDFLNPL